WGIFHGLFLVFDKLFLIRFTNMIGKIPSMAFTYFIVLISWVIFRSENLSNAFGFIAKMFSGGFEYHAILLNREMWAIMAMSFFFSFFPALKIGQKLTEQVFYEKHSLPYFLLYSCISIIILFLSVGAITSSGFNPFIYFRF
ncbi:MAG: hypothetical protein U9R19_01555, partial [Bacteroidota bacterium]|nr:hypothetical protein [Bacteroidota bacterium]